MLKAAAKVRHFLQTAKFFFLKLHVDAYIRIIVHLSRLCLALTCLHIIHCLAEGIEHLVEIFRIEEYLVLLKRHLWVVLIPLIDFLAFRQGQDI